MTIDEITSQLIGFNQFKTKTEFASVTVYGATGPVVVPGYINEFWTHKQRDANRLHEISYRTCFKPQLPRFFIERFSKPGEIVYDPFMGRGTTLMESALLGRVAYGNDINPLSPMLIMPRIQPPSLEQISSRLADISLENSKETRDDLLAFYHPETLKELIALKEYFLGRELDAVDNWIRMVAINRLTGHSSGFFSVYTLPPNQATSVKSQLRINARLKQTPPKRDIREIILHKSKSLLSQLDGTVSDALASVCGQCKTFTGWANNTPGIADASIDLIITSPPFLNTVDYMTDNWLRCWFAGIDAKSIKPTIPGELHIWGAAMTKVFTELRRVLKPEGCIAFEVGEVVHGNIRLEDAALEAGLEAGLEPILVLINSQIFTKTANCWGVANNEKGTNSNRIVLFRQKPV